MNYQKLFDYMKSHGVTMLESEMQEICHIVNEMQASKWISVNESLPEELETVFISNGKGWTSIGCLAYEQDCGWHWAESNGTIYEENGSIVAECESDDLDVKYWCKLPKPPINETQNL